MYFQYGSYQHTPNSVNLVSVRKEPRRGSKGLRYSSHISIDIQGDLYADPALTTSAARQADLNSKVAAIQNAYANDYFDAGFYQDDGTPTDHLIQDGNENNMSGTLVKYVNFPEGDRSEFATKRTFSIGIYAIFRDAYPGLVEYSSTIQQTGDGSAAIEWYRRPGQYAGWRITDPYPMIEYQQTGYALKIASYPVPPPPIANAPNYLGHMTRIVRHAPMRYRPGKYMLFRTEWVYHYIFPTTQPSLMIPPVTLPGF